jgi:aspartyl protease family protein
MQHILVFAVVVLLLAAAVPRMLQQPRLRPEPQPVVITRATPEAADARSISVPRSPNGQFSVEGTIDGRRVAFLIDTGASVVALRESEAWRLGFHLIQSDYTARMSTANGVVAGAPIMLDRVELGDLVTRNVAAVVLPNDSLAQNLLGMSFLSQVHWQYRAGRLVLEP